MRFDWRGVLSGQRRGVLPALCRGLLTAATPLYAAANAIRQWGYDRGWLKTCEAPVPVISVGNLTTGGTGKTPVVAWMVHELESLGLIPGILSRGYGRLQDGTNDEYRVLAQLCPGVAQVQNPDRAAGAAQAVAEHHCQVLVLDDGFQHRRLARQLDLVLIDALNPWGYGSLLPRGLLREPPRALGRAQAVAITRADQVDESARAELRDAIRKWTEAPLIEIAFGPTGIINARGERRPLSALQSAVIGACCGIGNPQAFVRTLTAAGCPPTPDRIRTYPDHHAYTPADVADLAEWVRACGIELVIVTQKDLVKLPHTHIGRAPLWALEIGVEFLSGAEVLREGLRTLTAGWQLSPSNEQLPSGVSR